MIERLKKGRCRLLFGRRSRTLRSNDVMAREAAQFQ
jgi:hypothetical protein